MKKIKDIINSPFTKNQVESLNRFQQMNHFHPFTCLNDGDEKHIAYEFEHKYPNLKYDLDYENYIKQEKSKGIPFPHMEFTETSLVATQFGWKCPVCDYRQNWAHSFMADIK